MALEEYIKQVKETWTNFTLDLVNYQNKCRLIRYAFFIYRLALYDDLNLQINEVDGTIYLPSAVRI